MQEDFLTFSPSAVLAALRAASPLVHCISNTVTAGDVANILLAVGGRPIMAQAEQEVGQIAAASSALVLNCGTPDEAKFRALRLAGQSANEAGKPVVLDPVGIGASDWRKENILSLLDTVHPTVIHCNASEALTVLKGRGFSAQSIAFSGVDSISTSEENRRQLALRLSQLCDCAVLLSGREDIVADGSRVAVVRGGSPLMSRVTGTGCMLSGLLGAFCAAEPDRFFAALAAASFWKECAQTARADAPGTLRIALPDTAYHLEYWRKNYDDFC